MLKIGLFDYKTEKIELFSKFFKSDSPIKKVLIEVLSDNSNSSSFVLIPLSEINGHW